MVRRHLDSLPLVAVTCLAAFASVALTASLSLSIGILAFVGLLVFQFYQQFLMEPAKLDRFTHNENSM